MVAEEGVFGCQSQEKDYSYRGTQNRKMENNR